nr:uncharacterized protein LOC113707441 [Coffea arabica]
MLTMTQTLCLRGGEDCGRLAGFERLNLVGSQYVYDCCLENQSKDQNLAVHVELLSALAPDNNTKNSLSETEGKRQQYAMVRWRLLSTKDSLFSYQDNFERKERKEKKRKEEKKKDRIRSSSKTVTSPSLLSRFSSGSPSHHHLLPSPSALNLSSLTHAQPYWHCSLSLYSLCLFCLVSFRFDFWVRNKYIDLFGEEV